MMIISELRQDKYYNIYIYMFFITDRIVKHLHPENTYLVVF